MRQILLSILIGLLLFVISVSAQSSRLTELAEQLEQNIDSLADRASGDFLGRAGNNRSELDNLLTARQLKATIETLVLLLNNNRPNSELRDAAESLNELSRKFSSNSSNNAQWRQIRRDLDELINLLKGSNSSSQNNDQNKGKGVPGKLQWQGTIDDEVHLIIKGGSVQIKTISGTEYYDAIFSFTEPLPEENVRVFINKKEGRGSAKVIQLPTAENDFTAIIQVLDKNGGAKEYELEIYWNR